MLGLYVLFLRWQVSKFGLANFTRVGICLSTQTGSCLSAMSSATQKGGPLLSLRGLLPRITLSVYTDAKAHARIFRINNDENQWLATLIISTLERRMLGSWNIHWATWQVGPGLEVLLWLGTYGLLPRYPADRGKWGCLGHLSRGEGHTGWMEHQELGLVMSLARTEAWKELGVS